VVATVQKRFKDLVAGPTPARISAKLQPRRIAPSWRARSAICAGRRAEVQPRMPGSLIIRWIARSRSLSEPFPFSTASVTPLRLVTVFQLAPYGESRRLRAHERGALTANAPSAAAAAGRHRGATPQAASSGSCPALQVQCGHMAVLAACWWLASHRNRTSPATRWATRHIRQQPAAQPRRPGSGVLQAVGASAFVNDIELYSDDEPSKQFRDQPTSRPCVIRRED